MNCQLSLRCFKVSVPRIRPGISSKPGHASQPPADVQSTAHPPSLTVSRCRIPLVQDDLLEDAIDACCSARLEHSSSKPMEYAIPIGSFQARRLKALKIENY